MRELVTDPEASAKAAGLRYVSDDRPGIRRKRAGQGFQYLGTDGRIITNIEERLRFRALAIPPAWTDVWICPYPNGHLQATGRDAKGRKQYRYHERWREVRDETKYERMLAFGQLLPQVRERTKADLAKPGLPREKVLATVVQLLESTHIRVGNEEYAQKNDSYGLTTLRADHVEVEGSRVHFRFRGKSGKEHIIDVHNAKLAKIVGKCQALPGQELFQYVDSDGELQAVDSSDVNDYVRQITGQDFTAKDFRTWAGTVLALRALRETESYRSATQAKKNVVAAIKAVAEKLGNTPSVCRKCYVHPAVIEAYMNGYFAGAHAPADPPQASSTVDLPEEEAALMALLEQAASRAHGQVPSKRAQRPAA